MATSFVLAAAASMAAVKQSCSASLLSEYHIFVIAQACQPLKQPRPTRLMWPLSLTRLTRLRLIKPTKPRPMRPMMSLGPLRPTRLKSLRPLRPIMWLLRPARLIWPTRPLMQIWPTRLMSSMRPIWPTRPVWPKRPLLQLTPPSCIFAVLASAFLSDIVATVEVSDDSLSSSPSQNMISKTLILSFLDVSTKMIGPRAPSKIWLMRSFETRIDLTINPKGL